MRGGVLRLGDKTKQRTNPRVCPLTRRLAEKDSLAVAAATDVKNSFKRTKTAELLPVHLQTSGRNLSGAAKLPLPLPALAGLLTCKNSPDAAVAAVTHLQASEMYPLK